MTTEGAQPRTKMGSQDDDGEPDQAGMVSTIKDGFKEEALDDGHSALQAVAQESRGAEVEDVSIGDQQHRDKSMSQAAEISTHAEETCLRSERAVNGQAPNEADNMGVSNIEPESLLPNYSYLAAPGPPDGSLDLAQVNEALVDDPTLEAATSIVESEAPRIQAFAKLEFDDGEFYMNTYSVELGRDVRAARQAYGEELRAIQYAGAKLRKQTSSSGNASPTSTRVKQDNAGQPAGSVVSESGGIMAVDPADSGEVRPRKHKKSKSTTSSSQQLSRRSSMTFPGMRTDYQALAMASLLDPSTDEHIASAHHQLPSPESCPLVPIHPPASTDGVPTSHKSISRVHVRIAFNFEKHLFELIVLGRNGAFVDEEWYPEGDVQPLRSGSLIQIGGVGIRFLLPDVAPGETGAENVLSSDPASFDLETGHAIDDDMEDSNDEERDVEKDRRDDDDEDESNENDQKDQSSEHSEEEPRGRRRRLELKPTVANRPVRNRRAVRGKEGPDTKEPAKVKPTAKKPPKLPTKEVAVPDPPVNPPKRKGPGRPPKNGIISKREQALLARQAREAAKASAQGISDPQATKGKGKSLPDLAETKQEKAANSLQPNGKRKYKKRKTKAEIEAGEQQAPRESTEHTDAVPPEQNAAPPPKPPKPMKPPKPPRSPSPVFDEASLTPEQLAKPIASYVILIHDALSNSPTGQMSLPQIYRAIERKYPFYKLRVQTTGWQSSVRHNLSQHPAFRKIERDGKGWMWGLVPEVSIEKEKKQRRMTPPPAPAQNYYPAPQMLQQPPYPYPPPASMPYHPYGPYAGLPMGQRPYAPPPHHYPPPPTASALPPALANAAQLDTSSTYQSPYATGPKQSNDEASKAGDHAQAANGQQPKTTSDSSAQSATQAQSQAVDKPTTSPYPLQNPPAPSITHTNHHRPAHSHLATDSSANPLLNQSQHSQEVLAVVEKFRSYLLNSMGDDPSAGSMIDSAVNRVLNPQSNVGPDSAGLGKEKAIVKILQGMLQNLRERQAGGVGAGSTFREILEKVGESGEDAASLKIAPPSSAHPPPQKESSTPPGVLKGGAGDGKESKAEVEDHRDAEDVGTQGKASNEAAAAPVMMELPTSKRARDEDVDEKGAMDAWARREAKRVAT